MLNVSAPLAEDEVFAEAVIDLAIIESACQSMCTPSKDIQLSNTPTSISQAWLRADMLCLREHNAHQVEL